MQQLLDSCNEKMDKSLNSLENEYQALRTGRASAAIFDKIKVDYYGQETPLNQVASISVPEARLVVIQPWDKNLISIIEKAILKSDLGFNPSNDGKVLRISFPPLTGERRRELAKQAKNISETARVAIRNIRRDGMEELKKLQKNGTISEDELKNGETRLQEMTDNHIAEIKKASDNKEKEILEDLCI